ncbi:MAG: DMT family transporter [Acidimicrobiia bacterium]|nr:DMT family transporter [Acidimicrobiia bacterium]
MAVALALLVAVFYGTGDFAGGLASRRASLLIVVLGSYVVGLVGVLVAAPVLAERPPTAADFGWGAVGGLFGLAGIVLLYRGLARGPMSVVAPLSAVSSAMVPLIWGLVDGERLSGLAGVGVALGLLSIVLVSAERRRPDQVPVIRRTVIEALLAGVGFGTFFVFLDLADDGSAPWPVVGARTLTVSLALLAAIRLRPSRPAAGVWWAIAAAGVFDVAANVTFLLATAEGDLAVVSVLSSMYPAATVLLAWTILRERISGVQVAGLALAAVAISLVGVG